MKSKPGSITAVSIIWIISGIVTIFWGFGLVIAAFTSLIGIVCLPLSIYPFVVGILELIYGLRLTGSSPRLGSVPYFVSILEIILIVWLDVFGLIAGITTVVLLNTEESKAFLSESSPGSNPASE